MSRVLLMVMLAILTGTALVAGDDASGPIAYGVDLGAKHTSYELTEADRRWSDSLVANLGYSGDVVHFVRTTLVLTVDEAQEVGVVYQALEHPAYYFVVPGDAMLEIGAPRPYSPGASGFSMHAPKSLDFIVCLNFSTGGVPFSVSSPVTRGQVTWNGRDWRRF